MGTITSPIELIDLADGASVTFRALRYERDRIMIYPRHKPEGKEVDVLRVHLTPDSKATFPPWWDITATTLLAQIEPHLKRPDLARLVFTVTAKGIAEKKRYQLGVEPT